MKELCDVYDAAGCRTGTVARRGSPLADGCYQMAANLWVFDRRGRILIQKRSPAKEYLPNIWATHGGGVRAGETSRAACVREAGEEIGIRVDPAAVHFLFRDISAQEHLMVDNFIVCREYDTASAVLQTEEVSALRWATAEEVGRMWRSGALFRYRQLALVLDYVRRHAPAR